jgi:hypothetical protein
MESTETTDPLESGKPKGILLTGEAQHYLHETAKWASFLSIVGFIMCGLFLLMAFFIGTIFSLLGNISPVYNQMPAGVGTFLTVIFILFDVLYFFFPFYLYHFARKAKRGIALSDGEELTEALSKLKSFFKLVGIVTIVMLCIYAIEIIGMIALFSMMPAIPQ